MFATAALDPTPLPSLVLLWLLSLLPAATAGLLIGYATPPINPIIFDKFFGISSTRLSGARLATLRKARKRLSIVAAAFFLLITYMSLTLFSIQNNATIVWRAFHANLEIVGPYISNDERKSILARFRLMKSKADFFRIRTELDQVSQKHGESLNWYQL